MKSVRQIQFIAALVASALLSCNQIAQAFVPAPPVMPIPIQIPKGLPTVPPEMVTPSELSDDRIKFILCTKIGEACIDQEDWARAIAFYTEALRLFPRVQAPSSQLSSITGALSIAYCGLHEMPLSVKFAELSLRAATDAIPGDPTDISIAYNNFAYVRKMMRNYREAQKMYECALRYAPRTTPQERFRAALMEANMGEAYVLGGNYDKAIVAYQRSLQVLKVLLPARHPALGELQQKIDALKGRAHVHRRKV